MVINVVTGAPCVGKSTYIAKHAKENDVVVDFDRIAAALCFRKSHDFPPLAGDVAQVLFMTAIDACAMRKDAGADGDVWIEFAWVGDRERLVFKSLGAVWHNLEAPKKTCLERAERDRRPARSVNGIHSYFQYHRDPGEDDEQEARNGR